MNWRLRAACRGMGPDLFFTGEGDIGDPTVYDAGRDVCARCPVTAECEAAGRAQESNELRYGLWGGLTPADRRGRTRKGRRRREETPAA